MALTTYVELADISATEGQLTVADTTSVTRTPGTASTTTTATAGIGKTRDRTSVATPAETEYTVDILSYGNRQAMNFWDNARVNKSVIKMFWGRDAGAEVWPVSARIITGSDTSPSIAIAPTGIVTFAGGAASDIPGRLRPGDFLLLGASAKTATNYKADTPTLDTPDSGSGKTYEGAGNGVYEVVRKVSESLTGFYVVDRSTGKAPATQVAAAAGTFAIVRPSEHAVAQLTPTADFSSTDAADSSLNTGSGSATEVAGTYAVTLGMPDDFS